MNVIILELYLIHYLIVLLLAILIILKLSYKMMMVSKCHFSSCMVIICVLDVCTYFSFFIVKADMCWPVEHLHSFLKLPTCLSAPRLLIIYVK